MQRSTPTLARRYLYKLLANVASVPVYLVMEAILPRALGPQMYGNYSFATNLFQQLSGFLDMGTSTCFYNALSRRQHETGLIAFYLRVSLLVACISLGLAWLMQIPAAGSLLMPDVPAWLAPLAAVWAFLTWWGRVLRSMNDAVGATVPSEMSRTVIALLAVLALASLYWLDILNVYSLFGQQYAMLAATALGYWAVSKKTWEERFGREGRFSLRLTGGQTRAYAREFFHYSHPLFVQALLTFAMLSVERWLLQWFDGSTQQAYYALAQKVCIACFLFVSAMTPLIMREFSIAWGNKDMEGMGRLMQRFAPLLYAVAAYFSCFSAVEAGALVNLFGGAEFAPAVLPVQIMAFYPLHQAYMQLASSVFHAAGRTRTTRNITMLDAVYGFAAVWLLLAPEEYLGLHLGAVGLACKTVGVQFITVNIQLYMASRLIPFSWLRNLAHQFWCLAVLLGLALVCHELTLLCGIGDAVSLPRFLCAGVLYTLSALLVLFLLPALAGLRRDELTAFLRRVLPRRTPS
ncbi:lipopolysaccharide biosynthesis protein [uncultured Desulfovibrio sp.]|uniref:lipopolysaccharide biosynthesis protein n=1 Tax=uncultured Desulfovibrio sp. TaxID=167968 RepID=UPI0025F82609|nr:lipopolysaccharide biosynthesis protein [uncultured Desulfovibrio sp.]